jgi:group I intron endonuclease
MIGIYKITCLITNKIYIGQSVDITYRFNQYKYGAVKNQIKIYNSLQKYGYSNHKFEILETFNEFNSELMTKREQYFIDYYRKNGCILLNIKEAGSNGKHSNETKLKIGESNKIKLKGRELSEEHINNIKKSLINNKRRLGVKVSDETKEKMKNSHKGVKKSEIHKKNISNVKKKVILQYSLDNILINEFNCADDVIKYLNVKSAKHIRNCASGYKKNAYGYIWKYKK